MAIFIKILGKNSIKQFSEGEDPVIKNEVNLDDYLDSSLLEKANKF